MLRRCLIALCLIAAALSGAGSAAAATVPDGPRLALARISFDLRGAIQAAPSNRPQFSDFVKEEVFTTDAFGGTHQTLIGPGLNRDFVSLSAANIAWSPDGSTLALDASNLSGSGTGLDSVDIYLIGADGSGLRRVTRVGNASAPVFSADGTSIYFQRIKSRLGKGGIEDSGQVIKRPGQGSLLKFQEPSSSIWAVNVDGTGLRQLTPSSKRVFETPASVSPLTGEIAVSRRSCTKKTKKAKKRCARSASLLSPATGAETVLLNGAFSPVFSPDGRKLALGSLRDHNFGKRRLLPTSELYVLDLGTGVLQRLTYSPGIDESVASWDPSGSRLAYIRASFAGFGVREINADGSCATPIAEPHGLFSRLYTGVAWQPGASRAAGPIAC